MAVAKWLKYHIVNVGVECAKTSNEGTSNGNRSNVKSHAKNAIHTFICIVFTEVRYVDGSTQESGKIGLSMFAVYRR